jgi:plastocyanin
MIKKIKMKTYLFISAFALYAGLTFAGKVTVTNSGFTFTPDSISISVNDTVVFQLASIHNVIEVSKSTWDANGNTQLPGGFSLPLGGGQLTGLTSGLHYYVCGPHASLGMKGRIYVTSGLGINNNEKNNGDISLFPNPTNGKFSLRCPESVNRGDENREIRIDIYNSLGMKIISQADLKPQTAYNLDLTSYPDGIYFISIADGNNINTVRILKR